MNEFIKIAAASKVPPGEMVTVRIAGEPVIIANMEGRYYGIGALCTHAKWDLSEGILEDTTITCAGHGTVWDLKTGKGIFDEPLEDEPVYEIREEDGFLFARQR